MPKTSFDEPRAYELYHAHKTDAEIAEVVGAPTKTIHTWRRRRKLKNISPNARKPYTKERKAKLYGVDYRKVLNPAQALVMNRFLRALAYAWMECDKAGIKPDVGRAMAAFSGGEVKSYAEQLTSAGYKRREKVANGK